MTYFCSICDRPLGRIVIENVRAEDNRYDIHYCDACNIGATTPVVSPEVLAELYSTGMYRGESGKRFIAPIESMIYLARLFRKRRIERHVARGRILDIGCGRGLFLDVMRSQGWSVAGVEFNEETAASASRAYGITIVPENRMGESFPDASFDVITMNHVLEHMYGPAETLRGCARLLREGGLLVVAVPNMRSLQADFGGRHWFHLDPPYHLHHFSEEGLTGMLAKHSFSVIRIRRFDAEYNIFGWLQTLLNRTGLKKNLLYEILKGRERKEKRSERVSKWDLFLTFVFLPFGILASSILSIIESFLLKKGGAIEVYATKGEAGNP
jgi:2-polyprenyl-3-methyl-5-hydroxy-6-metoxy-1,4-benzoquinol methylase